MIGARRRPRSESEAWAKAYHSDPLVARRRATYRRKLARLGLAGLPASQPLLDVACGSGEFLGLLAAGGAGPLVGIDLLRPPGPARTYRHVVADGCLLPFADASFAHVLCTHSLHHFAAFESIGQFLGEVRRVLAPGGRVYLVDHFGSLYLRAMFALLAVPWPVLPSAVRQLGAQLREERPYLEWWLRNWRGLFAVVRRSGLEVAAYRRGLFFFYLTCRCADE